MVCSFPLLVLCQTALQPSAATVSPPLPPQHLRLSSSFFHRLFARPCEEPFTDQVCVSFTEAWLLFWHVNVSVRATYPSFTFHAYILPGGRWLRVTGLEWETEWQATGSTNDLIFVWKAPGTFFFSPVMSLKCPYQALRGLIPLASGLPFAEWPFTSTQSSRVNHMLETHCLFLVFSSSFVRFLCNHMVVTVYDQTRNTVESLDISHVSITSFTQNIGKIFKSRHSSTANWQYFHYDISE